MSITHENKYKSANLTRSEEDEGFSNVIELYANKDHTNTMNEMSRKKLLSDFTV